MKSLVRVTLCAGRRLKRGRDWRGAVEGRYPANSRFAGIISVKRAMLNLSATVRLRRRGRASTQDLTGQPLNEESYPWRAGPGAPILAVCTLKPWPAPPTSPISIPSGG